MVPAAARFQDQFLAPETIENGDAGQCQCTNREHRLHKRHLLTDATHCHHVTRADVMDDSACCQEEQCLENGVTEEMELAGKDTACTDRINHVAQLADG